MDLLQLATLADGTRKRLTGGRGVRKNIPNANNRQVQARDRITHRQHSPQDNQLRLPRQKFDYDVTIDWQADVVSRG